MRYLARILALFTALLLSACSVIPTVVVISPTATTPGCDINAGMICTFVGGSGRGYTDGVRLSAQFNTPEDLVVDSSGYLYIADMGNHFVRLITPTGAVSSFVGSPQRGSADGVGLNAQFRDLMGMAMAPDGSLALADSDDQNTPQSLSIRLVSKDAVVTTFVTGTTGGYKDGPTTSALFRPPARMVFAPDGTLFIADTNNHRVRKISLDKMVTTYAGPLSSSTSSGYEDGPAADALFNGPAGIAIDPAGNLYISDSNNHVIRKITAEGIVSTLAGNGKAGYADGMGSAAQFSYPQGLAIDSAGNLYVADSANHMIRKVTPQGLVTTLAGVGTAGYTDGAPTEAQFRLPVAVAISADGVVYVADTGNHAIRYFKP